MTSDEKYEKLKKEVEKWDIILLVTIGHFEGVIDNLKFVREKIKKTMEVK